ncbi:MAG: HAMP domain-containing histidine kinase [Legionellaceae bacterium]|nr:HAMP domain-containing histidine kinase [Legionellaceae bacterium]
MTFFRYVVSYIDSSMQRRFANAAHQLVAVGAIVFIGFPFFYWVWTGWFPQLYDSFALRMLGSLLGLGLILTPFWPECCKKYLHWYWFFTIFYTLSFFFAFAFLMNQASVTSAMALLCSVFLLVMLVDLLSLSLLLLSGWLLATVCYVMLAPHLYFSEAHIEMLLVMVFVVIAGATFNYKTTMFQQQRLAGMAVAAGMIAHELRTPLLGIKSGAQVLARYAPEVMEGYRLAREHGLMDSGIRNHRLQQLTGVSERIVHETLYANTIIDMLLVKAGQGRALKNCVFSRCSMADCLQDAIARYPFKSKWEAEAVYWQGDFSFSGEPLLMQHVLFNLLKNALYAISVAQKGEIRIWTEAGEKGNRLIFQDTGKGMTPAQLRKLFHHFYTTTFMGTGIGLSFCKLVMQRFRGDIRCESKLGEYTRFILSFPLYQE